MKTYAEESGVEAFSPRDSLRAAFQLGVIQESPEWFRVLEDRHLTSRAYNEATADTIYSHLPAYTRLIRHTVDKLTRRAKE